MRVDLAFFINKPILHLDRPSRHTMYTVSLITGLAAIGAIVKSTGVVARQADNSVAVNFNNVTFGGVTDSEEAMFPQLKEALIGFVGPYDIIALMVGPGVVDQKLHCRIFAVKGHVILVNRGANIGKSTFLSGLPWQVQDGLTENSLIACVEIEDK